MNKERYFILIAGIIFGICLTMLFIDLTEEDNCYKQYDSCWAAVQGADSGHWISVNIDGMSFERAVEICKHEVGHEIFAEMCEDDIDRCFNISKGLDDSK